MMRWDLGVQLKYARWGVYARIKYVIAWHVGPTPFAGCRASTHRVMRITIRGARFMEIIVNRLLGLLISYDAWHRHASLQLPWVCSSCDFLLQRLELIIFAIGLGPTRRVRTRNAIPP